MAFPRVWKSARLVLLFKGGDRSLDETSSLRPINLLDSTAKLFERLVLGRIEKLLSRSGSFLIMQHGFRRGTGTVQAMKKILDFAEEASGTRSTERKTSVLITLDVQNAFNSIVWRAIDDSIRKRGVDDHLI